MAKKPKGRPGTKGQKPTAKPAPNPMTKKGTGGKKMGKGY